MNSGQNLVTSHPLPISSLRWERLTNLASKRGVVHLGSGVAGAGTARARKTIFGTCAPRACRNAISDAYKEQADH
jgi:hypothetical protein